MLTLQSVSTISIKKHLHELSQQRSKRQYFMPDTVSHLIRGLLFNYILILHDMNEQTTNYSSFFGNYNNQTATVGQ